MGCMLLDGAGGDAANFTLKGLDGFVFEDHDGHNDAYWVHTTAVGVKDATRDGTTGLELKVRGSARIWQTVVV